MRTLLDAVQDTSTTTGSGDFTVTGTSPAGCQPLSAVPTGATFPYYIGHQSTAEFETGTATKTGTSTFSRSPLRSSNGNALVNFTSGTKDVLLTLHADAYARGLVDPDDVGYDIVLCVGQSNMVGRGTIDTLMDMVDARVMQFGGASAQSRYRTIFSGASPTHNAEALQTTLSPQTHFGKAYAASVPAHRSVLLVPCAYGGTTLVTPNFNSFTTPPWSSGNPGGTLYENAIAQANLAITEAQKTYPNSRFVGIIWHQGESDGDNSVSQSAYATALTAMIAGFRARITGAANSWFIIGGLMPEAIAANGASYNAIVAAHQQVAAATSKCTYVAGPSGYQADTWHYTAAGSRILGARMALAVKAAQFATGVPVAATAITLSGPSGGVVSTASSAFTVALSPVGGTLSGTTTVTPSDGGAGGTFSPSTVSLTQAAPSATFTYTPASTGSKTISVTNNGGLSNPSSLTYSVSAAATVPGAPTIGTATAGNASAAVAFTAPASDGGAAITGYTVTSSPGGITASGSSSPINVTGLTNGTAYTFTVHATNSVGNSAESAASNSVTPAAPSFATFSATDKNSTWTLSNANLTATNSGAAAWSSARATTGKTAGKWYWEVTFTGSNRAVVGIGDAAVPLSGGFVGQQATGNGWGLYAGDGSLFHNNSNVLSGTPTSFAAGDVIGVELDMDAKTVRFYKNSTALGTAAATGLPSAAMYPMVSSEGAGYAFTINCGQSAFARTPSAGFVGLA